MSSTLTNDPMIGLVIDGKYTIIEPIGRGGMGSVYRARQDAIKRDVAIKFLSVSSFESQEQFTIRFKREAETASRIRNPAAITIFDYGVGSFGTLENCPYLVMEFIDGKTLKDLYQEGRVTLARLMPLTVQVCGALEEAHSLGIIHRDLKPENIMVSRRSDGSEWAHVLDFGIAKQIIENSDPGLTREGSVMGTPRYMAPEQIWQKPVDGRTDIYALALVLYEGITGSLPVDGTSLMDIAIKISTSEAEPISKRAPDANVPKALEKVIMRALRKDPDERQATAHAFAVELMNASPPDFKFSSGALAFSGFSLPTQRQKWHVPVIAIGLAILVAVAGWTFSSEDSSKRRSTSAVSSGTDGNDDETSSETSDANGPGETTSPSIAPPDPEIEAKRLAAEQQRIAAEQERIVEEARRKELAELEKQEAARILQESEAKRLEAEARLKELERKAVEAEAQLEKAEAERRDAELKQQAAAAERKQAEQKAKAAAAETAKRTIATPKNDSSEKALAEANRKAQELERRANESEQRAREAEAKAAAERNRIEAEKRKLAEQQAAPPPEPPSTEKSTTTPKLRRCGPSWCP